MEKTDFLKPHEILKKSPEKTKVLILGWNFFEKLRL